MSNLYSTIASSSSFDRVNIDADNANLLELHNRVHRRNGRVELVAPEGGTSVLISKSELDALEGALQILSDTDDVRDMRDELTRIAASSMSVA